MDKNDPKSHTFLKKITAFILMISLTVSTAKGRALINTVANTARQVDQGIKIGFKIILYLVVILFLYMLKRWLF